MTATVTGSARDDRAAVDKAISLLVALGDRSSGESGVSALARRAQMSKSTAYRVLGMLERNGVVERVGTDYRLGERLHHLGKAVYAPGSESIRDMLLPYLADLYEASRETVHLAVLDGPHVVYLAKLYGHRPAPVPSRIGGRLPAYATAVGKVLLAYDYEAAERVLSQPLRSYSASTITDPDELSAELDDIRRSGVAFDNEEYQPGLACVAVPVLNRAGRAVAALSVAGRLGQIDTRRLSVHARRVAAAASQAAAKGLARTA
ncbi:MULTISPECIES: IclR family transcriptional regulator [unclassified Streptomyces]|uniref:IclR family transcriptional regulator n=1 Tax=unclassified Streptomyces TaxID=2593676 RepID=UPI0023657F4F|nr:MULTISPECIES: IclR family transcriptional regulator [unclassified Streptomyces]MDF3141874.1 IclR family transcriptional regulator [Streptomyces sp. T21Q-yed]WDF36265.1 IclR family transcriptional regulator [Streptomyces sp. T12]